MTRITVSSLSYWDGATMGPDLEPAFWDGATMRALVPPFLVIPEGYADVTDMLSRPMVYMAHRGGSADYPQMSLRAYTQAAVEGFGCLELPGGRTLDGVIFGSGDNGTLNEEAGIPGNDLVIADMTWAEVQAYTIAPPSQHPERQRQPFMRIEELVEAYGPTHIIMFDPKTINSSYYPQILDYMDANGGPDRWLGKWVGSNQTWSDALHARGYTAWGAFYDSDDQAMVTAAQVQWDLLGFNYGASQTDWDFILSFGKPVYAHVCPTQVAVDTGVAKGAVGAQVSGIEAVNVYKLF
jgi:Glycerophosphoryl diester phosphodiesterase family